MGQRKSKSSETRTIVNILRTPHLYVQVDRDSEIMKITQKDKSVTNVFGWEEEVNLALNMGSIFNGRIFDVKTR